MTFKEGDVLIGVCLNDSSRGVDYGLKVLTKGHKYTLTVQNQIAINTRNLVTVNDLHGSFNIDRFKIVTEEVNDE